MSHRLPLRYVAQAAHKPHSARTWVRPVGLVRRDDPAAIEAWPLAGGWMGFTSVDVVMVGEDCLNVWRTSPGAYLAASADKAAAEQLLERLTAPRADFAGLSMSKPQLMGIVNATPDSFSDGGQHFTSEDALAGARDMAEAGAAILDIGGESTRPGAEPVSHDEEKRRILPVISALLADGHVVSADTRHTEVMQAASDAGAQIINDVSGFRDDGAVNVPAGAARTSSDQGYAIAMHMQGAPQTMQANPHYDFAPLDIYDYLEDRIAALLAAGVPADHIAIDPGFGFGKTVADNLALIRWTSLFHGLGVPILIGVSRKSTIGKIADAPVADKRVPGTVALSLEALAGGAQIHRVHDVADMKQAFDVWLA